MNNQFNEKFLAVATLAALIGMDGFFSLIDQRIRGAGNESAIHAQASPADNIVISTPRLAAKPVCTQNDWSFGDEPELLVDEETAPLTDEEFERIEWNADQEEILRNASNQAYGQKALHHHA